MKLSCAARLIRLKFPRKRSIVGLEVGVFAQAVIGRVGIEHAEEPRGDRLAIADHRKRHRVVPHREAEGIHFARAVADGRQDRVVVPFQRRRRGSRLGRGGGGGELDPDCGKTQPGRRVRLEGSRRRRVAGDSHHPQNVNALHGGMRTAGLDGREEREQNSEADRVHPAARRRAAFRRSAAASAGLVSPGEKIRRNRDSMISKYYQ